MDKKDLIPADSIQKTMPQIWKISHGSHGRGVKKELLDKLEKRHVVAVDSVTKAVARQKVEQGELFTNQIKKGDFFYLCYGRNIRLLGKFTSDKALPNKEMGEKWYERKYQVIAQTKNMSGYEGKRKLWTPNFNSTCILIKPNEQKQFEELILKPYFDLSIEELSPSINVIKKLARISWNTYNWTRPSGPNDKSTSQTSYEGKYGFAHEEWLFDDIHRMDDGYQYGFLQQFNVESDIYVNQKYDVHLFSINHYGVIVYVGIIHNLVVTSEEERKRVFNHYKAQGWLVEMKEQVMLHGLVPHDMNEKFLFNVKFKMDDVKLCGPDYPKLDPMCVPGHRYNLMDMKTDLKFVVNKETGRVEELNTETYTRTNKEGKVLVDPRHKKIQNALKDILEKDYTHVRFEEQHVDIKGVEKETHELHFFEVKTLNTAKQCIREALGQILEYTHYLPNDIQPKKLFIVGDQEPSNTDKKYMKLLRDTYNLPIWYRWYEIAKDSLHKRI